MKKFEFESNGSKWLLVDMSNDQFLYTLQDLLGYALEKASDYFLVYSITEEQASEVVELHEYQHNPTKVLFKYHNRGIRKWTTSAIESLHSLFKSKGVHLFDNPYRDDWDELCTWGHGDFSKDGKSSFQLFTEAEEKTFYNPVLFKII